MKDHIYICNNNIHKSLGISRKEFLDKTRYVEQIRCSNSFTSPTYYITSEVEYESIINFHTIVNQANFPEYEGYKLFLIAVKPKIYNYFKSYTFDQILLHILLWKASIYFFNSDKREIYDEQFYPPVLEQVKVLVDEVFKIELDSFENKHELNFFLEYKGDKPNAQRIYHKICNEIYGDLPPEFLRRPTRSEKVYEDWGIKNYNFSFIQSYFTEKDWNDILIKGSQDRLSRVESRRDLWIKWRHNFQMFRHTNNPIYSLFLIENPFSRKAFKDVENKLETVYLMRNSFMKEQIFKIGRTSKSSKIRASSLSNTSVPDKFHVLFDWKVSDSKKIEKLIQTQLKEYRIDPKREFFQLEVREAIKIIDSIIEAHD